MSEINIQNTSETVLSQETKYKPAAFAYVSLLLLFVFYQLIGGGITLLIIGKEITTNNVIVARLATMFSQIIFLLIPTILLAKRQHGKLPDVFRFRIPTFLETFLAVIGMIALMQIGEMYLFFQSKIPLPQQIVPIIDAMKKAMEEAYKILIVAHSIPEMLFVVLIAALTPAICEEFVFRGLIQKNFTIAYGNRKGFIVAGTIFACYHLNPFWLIPLIALGIYFSFLQYRSQTLLLPILAHLINNGAATVGVYFYGMSDTTTPTMFMGEQNEPSTMAVLGTALFMVIIFSLIMYQYIKTTKHVHIKPHIDKSPNRSVSSIDISNSEVPEGFVRLLTTPTIFSMDMIAKNLHLHGIETCWKYPDLIDAHHEPAILFVKKEQQEQALSILTSLDLLDFTIHNDK